jgi:hypothetical protein
MSDQENVYVVYPTGAEFGKPFATMEDAMRYAAEQIHLTGKKHGINTYTRNTAVSPAAEGKGGV